MSTIPRNSYFLWLKENRDQIKNLYFSNYELKIIDGKKEKLNILITKKAGEVWKNLDQYTKDSYKEKLKLMNDDNPPTYEHVFEEKKTGSTSNSKSSEKDKKKDKSKNNKKESKVSLEKSPNRKNIPLAIKRSVWNKYIETEDPKKLQGKCFVGCGREITIVDFELGHVNAFSKGGDDSIDNLRPICCLCNRSMGVENLFEFKKKYGMTNSNLCNDERIVRLNDSILDLEKNKVECKNNIKPIKKQNNKIENEIKELVDHNESISIILKMNKDNFTSTTKNYKYEYDNIMEQLKNLKNKYDEDIDFINSEIKVNTDKVSKNNRIIKEKKKKLEINIDCVKINNLKIKEINDKIKNINQEILTINNSIKLEKDKLYKEIEVEVKKELEREKIRNEIKDKLLSSNKDSVNLINL